MDKTGRESWEKRRITVFGGKPSGQRVGKRKGNCRRRKCECPEKGRVRLVEERNCQKKPKTMGKNPVRIKIKAPRLKQRFALEEVKRRPAKQKEPRIKNLSPVGGDNVAGIPAIKKGNGTQKNGTGEQAC